MTLSDLALWIGVGIAGVAAVPVIRSSVWKAISAYKLRRAGPRPLRAAQVERIGQLGVLADEITSAV